MKRRKIGPGVYVIDAIGTIEMDQWVIDDRKARGLSVPPQRPNTGIKTDAAIAVDGGEDCSNRGAAYA